MPNDKDLQAAVGRVAIRHGQLDHFLRMTLKSIDNITPEEASSRTRRMTSGPLCECVRMAGRAKLGDSDAFKLLDALLTEAASAADEKNKLMQALWATGEDGGRQYRPRGGPAVPTVPQLDAIASRLDALAEQLNDGGWRDFLKAALER